LSVLTWVRRRWIWERGALADGQDGCHIADYSVGDLLLAEVKDASFAFGAAAEKHHGAVCLWTKIYYENPPVGVKFGVSGRKVEGDSTLTNAAFVVPDRVAVQ
jgi:hypothetical protein